MTDIYFLVVNYNNSDVTYNCIVSIEQMSTVNLSITIKCIIVDNGSNIEEREKIKKICNCLEKSTISIKLLLSENIGYFPAFNLALETIPVKNDISVVLCNNDLEFESDFLLKYFSSTYNHDVFVISPDIINKLGHHQNPHLIKRFSWLRIVYYYCYYISYAFAIMLNHISSIYEFRTSKANKLGYDKSQYITMGFGACYILTPNFFKYYSRIDDYTFLMGEEGELAYQVLKIGGRTYYDSDLKVFHHDSATFRRIPSKTTYRYSRNSFWISKKYYGLRDLYDPLI